MRALASWIGTHLTSISAASLHRARAENVCRPRHRAERHCFVGREGSVSGRLPGAGGATKPNLTKPNPRRGCLVVRLAWPCCLAHLRPRVSRPAWHAALQHRERAQSGRPDSRCMRRLAWPATGDGRRATGTGETGTSASSARLALPCSCLRFAPRHPPTQVLACLALLAAHSLAGRRRNGGETLRVRDATAMVLMADGRRCADRRQKKRARSPHGGAAVVSFGHTTASLPPTPPSSLPLPSSLSFLRRRQSHAPSPLFVPQPPAHVCPADPGPTACSIHGLFVAPLTASSCFC